jgi:hypothetical protein
MYYNEIVALQIVVTFLVALWLGWKLHIMYGKTPKHDFSQDFEWSNKSPNTNSFVLFDMRNKVFYPTVKIIRTSEKDPKKYPVSKDAMHKASWRRGVKKDVWISFLKVKDSYKDVWDFISKTF